MNHIEVQYFLEELKKSKTAKELAVYFTENNNWINSITNEVLLGNEIVTALERRSKHGYTKVTINNISIAIFWLNRNQIAVTHKIPSRTHEKTLKEFHENLKAAFRSASQAFFANHDPLTGLLNRNGGKLELERKFQSFSENSSSPLSNQELISNKSIVVFSFDIDHFKQINDTYGHSAGDLILTIFASRLKNGISKSKQILNGTAILSRPGGEEFELVLLGDFEKSGIQDIAEQLLDVIRTPALPTQQELSDHKGMSTLGNQPSLNILASIGIARSTVRRFLSTIDELVDQVRRQADLALYRAKNDGRNCARFFEDIRKMHGRVVEYHADSDIAIIDIGNLVEAATGDRYKVYYPPLTGDEDCIDDSGRSKKIRGTYIGVAAAEIQILHTQDSISTCVVINKQTSAPIPKGALLRRIAIGSKAISVSPRHLNITIGDREQLHAHVNDLIASKTLLAVLNISSFSIKDSDLNDHAKKLSEYIAFIYLIFPAGTRVYLGNIGTLFVILKKPTESLDIQSAKEYIERQLDKLKGKFTFNCGIYLNSSLPSGVESSAITALHFSRAALKASRNSLRKASSTGYFDARATLLAWQDEGNLEDLIADYQAFKTYGIEDPLAGIHLGLAVLTTDDAVNFRLGEVALSTASSAEPDVAVHRANLALLKTRMGEYEDAYELFKSAEEFVFKTSIALYPMSYAKSALEVRNNKGTVTDEVFLKITGYFTKSAALAFGLLVHRVWWSEINSELQKIGKS